jgi:hypothetical protein
VSLDAEGHLYVDGSQPGGYSFTVIATDDSSPPETTSRQFGISFAPSVTLSYPLPESRDVYVGNAISITPVASGHWPLAFTAAGLPPGLQIHPTTGVISGTVTTPGLYHIVTSVTDSLPGAAQTQQTGLTIRVYGSPIAITSTGIGPAAKAQAYTGQVVATGGTGALHYSATGLPAGLQIDATTGSITGTPTGFGPHAITLTVTDSQPNLPSTTTSQASMTVSSTTDLQLQLNLPASCKTGQFYAGGISGAYGQPSYSYELISGTLPQGLVLNTTTGIVSGNPTAAVTKDLRFRVTDSNDPPLTAEANATIQIYNHFPLILTTTQEQMQGTPNVPYSVTLSASGGSMLNSAGYTFEVSGLENNEAGLVFDGTATIFANGPVAATTAPIPVSITVRKGAESVTVMRTIIIAPPLSWLTNETLYSFAGPFAFQLEATGGSSLSFSGSSLPTGAILSPSGILWGMAVEPGMDIEAVVTDVSGLTSSKTFHLVVMSSPSPAPTPAPTPGNQNGGGGPNDTTGGSPDPLVGTAPSSFLTVNDSYNGSVDVIGGIGPFTFNAGSLPSGLSCDADGNITGSISQEGTFPYTVTIMDATGKSITVSGSIQVGPPQQPTSGGSQTSPGPQPSGGQNSAPQPKLATVSFEASGLTAEERILLMADAKPPINQQTSTYIEPHWQDENLDGTALCIPGATPGTEHNYPVAYVQGSRPAISATVSFQGTAPSGTVYLKASGTVNVPEMKAGTTVLADALPSQIAFYNAEGSNNAFTLNWEYKIGKSGSWSSLGTSKHTVYVVATKPTSLAYAWQHKETLYNLACRPATGKLPSDTQGIFDAVWNEFQSRNVRPVKPSSGTLLQTAFKYDHSNPTTSWTGMLESPSSDAQCTAWSELFRKVLLLNGVTNVKLIKVRPPAAANAPLNQIASDAAATNLNSKIKQNGTITSKIYVQTCTLNSNGFLSTNQGSISGQGGTPQYQEFTFHEFVLYKDNQWVDPSYGMMQVSSGNWELDWEKTALANYGYEVELEPITSGLSYTKDWLPTAPSNPATKRGTFDNVTPSVER